MTISFMTLSVFFIGEIFLRLLPIPGIEFNMYTYDEIVGIGLYPRSAGIYRNAKGDFIKRKINRWGYMDRDHVKEKGVGIYRIGFFGDSYTQARHVRLNQTFFRLIESCLRDYKVECLSFGVRGYGTLQSYLNSQRWSDFFDLDLIVYVFCENDLGDQIKTINRAPDIPYPTLAGNDFIIDDSFREKYRYKKTILYRVSDYLTAHSLLIATITERIKLLYRYGIKMRASKEDRMMATKAKNESEVLSTDLPSTWPSSLRVQAQQLGSAVISKWRDDVISQKRDFVILYVPREGEFEKETKDQDSWKLWLESLCREKEIRFIDPTPYLLDMKRSGKDVFYDHFTVEGHIAFANAFVMWFKESHRKLPGYRRKSSPL